MFVELTEEEKVGLRVLVLLREGELKAFDCSTCSRQKERNCSGDDEHKESVFYHPEVGSFFCCPMTVISASIMGFIDLYDYLEKYPSAAPKYSEVNPRYWAAVKFYEGFKYKLNNEESSKKGDDKDRLAKMRNLLQKGK